MGYVSGFWLIRKFPFLLSLPCPVKATLHIPCPSCGSSRSLVALGHFDITTAISMNPLFTVVFIISLLVVANAFLQVITGYRVEIPRLPGKFRLAVIVLLALNQLYLLATGL